MAKKAAKSEAPKENKSLAIREYIAKNPEIGPTAIAEALNAAHGWDMSAAYVSTIKNKSKSASSGGSTKVARGGGLSEKSLIQAKDFAKSAGGIHQAKAALELLAKLQS